MPNIKPALLEEITIPLSATTPSGAFFICDDNYQVVSVSAVAEVLGGAGATVTVEVLTGVQAPGAGVAQLTAALALNGTAHQVVNGAMIAAPTTAAAGNRIGIVMAGTLTGLVGVVAVGLQRVWATSDSAIFMVTGPVEAQAPALMTLAAAQAISDGFARKRRGEVYVVRDVNGSVVYTSPTFAAVTSEGT
jgi:predicted ATPase